MQYARPASDGVNNEWLLSSGVSAFSLLDETSPSDADYIYTSPAPTGPDIILNLSSVTDPASATDHVIRFRASSVSGSPADPPPGDVLTVELYEGATLRASTSEEILGSYTTYEYTLTAGEANSITDYTNLKFKVISTVGSFDTSYVSWIEFQVPYVAGAGSFEIAEAYLGSAYTFMHDKPGMSGYGQQDMVRVRVQNSKEWQGNERMKGDDPIDEQDAMNGGICSLSGQWFPGHSLVKVGGKQYGRRYAPTPEQNRKGIPRLPGD